MPISSPEATNRHTACTLRKEELASPDHIKLQTIMSKLPLKRAHPLLTSWERTISGRPSGPEAVASQELEKKPVCQFTKSDNPRLHRGDPLSNGVNQPAFQDTVLY